MVETEIVELRIKCIKCGHVIITIRNAIIPITFNMNTLCIKCNHVIKERKDVRLERFECDCNKTNQKSLNNPEKYI